MEIVERDTGTDTPMDPSRRRGQLVAAAAVALVILIVVVVIAIIANRSDADVAAPVPTTPPAPATVPATTAPAPTTVPATTVPATTIVVATVAAPQVYEATLTWDGETCMFDGPTEARVGDSLTVTGVNTSAGDMWPQLHYLKADATLESVNSYFDDELGNLLTYGVTPGWTWYDADGLGYLHPPPDLGMITVFDTSVGANSTSVLGANSESNSPWRLNVPREYLFVCAEMIDVQGKAFQEQRLSDRTIDNASQTVRVTE